MREDAKFCPKCGGVCESSVPTAPAGPNVYQNVPAGPNGYPNAPIPANTYAAPTMPGQPVQNKQMKKAPIILAAIGIVIAVVIFLSLLGGSGPVELVKDGKLNAYPDETVGEAFGDFFSDPEWSTYEDDGETYVKFTGGCYYDDEEVDVKIVFLVDGEEFEIDSAKVDGREMAYVELIALLNEIYE